MITNINKTPLKAYAKAPNNWKKNAATYSASAPSVLYADGWRELAEPEGFDPGTQRKGAIFYDEAEDVAGWEVIDLTPDQIRTRKMQGAESITPAQGRLQLAAMGMLSAVLATLPEDDADPVKIYWEYALNWDLSSPYVQDMAQALGLSADQLDDFFIEASKIV